MSFLDKIKYINQLAVMDEFGGRGHADKITRFCIVLRVTDGNGEDIQITATEIEGAVKAKNIVLCNYLNNEDFTLGIAAKNPDKCDFIVSDTNYINRTNIITINMGTFSDNASISVKLLDGAGALIISTIYLSDFPSCFFLNKKTTG